MIWSDTNRAALPTHFRYAFYWKSTTVVSMCVVMVPVYLRLTVLLSQSRGFQVHDGPGLESDQVNHNSSVIHLSSFLAFVLLLTRTWPDQSNTSLYLHIFGLKYFGRQVSDNYHLSGSNVVELPSCGNSEYQISTVKSQLKNQKKRHLQNKNNVHCVYNITTHIGSINLSIKSFTLLGLPFKLTGANYFRTECLSGGLAFNIAQGRREKTVYTRYVRLRFLRMSHVCTNISSAAGVRSGKSMDIFSEGNNFVVVAYSFKPYTQIFLKADVSVTPCQGLSSRNLYAFMSHLSVKIKAKSCIVLQLSFHHMESIELKVVENISQQLHHVLYRVDQVTLLKGKIKSNFLQHFNMTIPQHDMLVLHYYQGRFLTPPQLCCEDTDRKFLQILNKGSNTEVHYKYTNKTVFVETHSVTHPSPKFESPNRPHFHTSFRERAFRLYPNSVVHELSDFWLGEYHSEVLSFVYFIDCVELAEEISEWSWLSVPLVKDICHTDYLVPIEQEHTHLRRPNPELEPSILWDLRLSFHNLKGRNDLSSMSGEILLWTRNVCLLKEILAQGRRDVAICLLIQKFVLVLFSSLFGSTQLQLSALSCLSLSSTRSLSFCLVHFRVSP